MIKPDGVQRGLVGPILTRFEQRGLKIVGLKLMQVPKELAEKRHEPKWYDMSQAVEEYMKNEKHIWCNVDFYSASVHYLLGLPTDQFTPFFAMSRVTGWSAHIMEQLANNRLIRPRAEYVGPEPLVLILITPG